MEAIQIDSRRETTRALAVVLGFMCIGLLITAISCLGFSIYFSNMIANAGSDKVALNSACNTINMIFFGGIIGMLVLSLVNSFALGRSKKGGWIPYALYAAVMGLVLAPTVMWIDTYTVGMAFGLTAGVFLVLFLIGFFSKANLTPLGLIGLGLMFSVILVPLPFLILFIISPATYAIWNVIAAIATSVAIVLIVAFEANRMSREIQGGTFTYSSALYYAYSFYNDFILIFIRLLMVLVANSNRN